MTKKEMITELIQLGCINDIGGRRLMRELKSYVENRYNFLVPRRLAYLTKIREENKR